jgi:phosphatidylinositol dimannoside acyltransferase
VTRSSSRARLDAPATLGGGAAGPTAEAGLGNRALLRLLLGALAIARRLPDRPIYRLAFLAGRGLSRVMPARRALVRANLARVCAWLVAEGRAGPVVAAAASDPGRLDALTREAFGHWLVTYAEAALAPRYGAEALRERIVAHDPGAAAAALARPGPGEIGRIQLGLHFGSVELAGLYGTRVSGLPVTAPMERVAGTLARAWFEHVRTALGITIVPIAGAGEVLAAALRRGEMVGLVADRVITGGGARVDLFGSPARLPVGPAVLAIQTGAPIHLQAVRRTAPGRWVGYTVPILPPGDGGRRLPVRGILEAQARAFERVVAEAPEQWSTLFFPIWEDRSGDA